VSSPSSVVLLGPPGSGKGTQAAPIAAERDLLNVSTGRLLRAAVKEGTPEGQEARSHMDMGGLVPDALVIALLMRTIPSADQGVLLDGFPRTVAQAEALDESFARMERPVPFAVLIDVPDDVLVERIGGRRLCAAEGHEYHLEYRPPRSPGKCDVDGSPLVRRDDDEPDTVRRRLTTYHRETEPLVAYYEARGRLRRVDGDADPGTVQERMAAALGG